MKARMSLVVSIILTVILIGTSVCLLLLSSYIGKCITIPSIMLTVFIWQAYCCKGDAHES